MTHAITIDVPSEQVWPWLVQMGWHRGGWYTARWVDRLLFPGNAPSLDRLDPALQHLQVGDFVPDGPPESECGFTVVQLTPNRALVLHSTSHLPLSWRERLGAAIEWTWSFALVPQNAGRSTRFLFRWRGRVAPWWAVTGCWLVVVPADFVMSQTCCAASGPAQAEASLQPCPVHAVTKALSSTVSSPAGIPGAGPEPDPAWRLLPGPLRRPASSHSPFRRTTPRDTSSPAAAQEDAPNRDGGVWHTGGLVKR